MMNFISTVPGLYSGMCMTTRDNCNIYFPFVYDKVA